VSTRHLLRDKSLLLAGAERKARGRGGGVGVLNVVVSWGSPTDVKAVIDSYNKRVSQTTIIWSMGDCPV